MTLKAYDVKHAGRQALAALAPLVRKIREHSSLAERTPGCFYRKSQAYLHFHEDPAGFFADLKIGSDFTRFPVNTRTERTAFLRRVAENLH